MTSWNGEFKTYTSKFLASKRQTNHQDTATRNVSKSQSKTRIFSGKKDDFEQILTNKLENPSFAWWGTKVGSGENEFKTYTPKFLCNEQVIMILKHDMLIISVPRREKFEKSIETPDFSENNDILTNEL